MNCPDNCGCKVMMHRNAEDIQTLFKAINRMIWAVVISSSTIVLYMLVIGVTYIMKHLG